jgi:hypothetical protein
LASVVISEQKETRMSPLQDVSHRIDKWLSQDLDQWTQYIVRRHFDPETGSPYWLKRAAELPIDPRDITRYEQLSVLGSFQLPELRTLDPVDLVPLAVRRPIAGMVWETGGTTGDPCRIIYTEPMEEHRRTWRRWAMERYGYQPGKTWIQATPSGPHIYGHHAWDQIDLYDGRVYGIDFDPRWVKHLLRAGKLREVAEYTDHLIDQIAVLMESQRIDYMVTTPALLQAVVRREPEMVARLQGAWLSGTHVTPEMWRDLDGALDGGRLAVMYGNTLGSANNLRVERDGDLMLFGPNYPQITMTVTDPEDWTKVVDYGDYGRVRLTLMYDDLFLPNIQERDLAMRYNLGEEWPCEGVANVSPLLKGNAAPEGLY